MSMTLDTRGVLAKFDKLEKALKNKVGKKAITAGLKASSKAIKKLIPSRVKDARKAVGYRFEKEKKGPTKGAIIAKVGMGVGKQTKARKLKAVVNRAKAKQKRNEKNKPGVGIAGQNIHWFVLGTKKRETGSVRKRKQKNKVKTEWREPTGGKVKNTGRMKADPDLKAVVRQGVRQANPEAIIKAELIKGIEAVVK